MCGITTKLTNPNPVKFLKFGTTDRSSKYFVDSVFGPATMDPALVPI